jgi:hypothetical protein
MTDVFISYSSKDEKLAQEIYKLLSEQQIDVFLAGISLEAGEEWLKKIRKNLKRAKWLIFLATKNACESTAVKHELGAGWYANKNIVPVLWGVSPSEMPEWLQSWQAVDISNGDLTRLEPVITKIADKIQSNQVMGTVLFSALVAAFVALASEK